MLPCEGCAYKREVPGSAHIACAYQWETVPYATRRWFLFPFNYDPLWGPDHCHSRAEVADPKKIIPDSPMFNLISILGGRHGA